VTYFLIRSFTDCNQLWLLNWIYYHKNKNFKMPIIYCEFRILILILNLIYDNYFNFIITLIIIIIFNYHIKPEIRLTLVYTRKHSFTLVKRIDVGIVLTYHPWWVTIETDIVPHRWSIIKLSLAFLAFYLDLLKRVGSFNALRVRVSVLDEPTDSSARSKVHLAGPFITRLVR